MVQTNWRETYSFFLPLAVINGVERPYKKKRLKKEKTRPLNDAWKSYLKTENR